MFASLVAGLSAADATSAATLPVTSPDAAAPSTPVVSTPTTAPSTTISPGPTELFADIAPDSMTYLPTGPIGRACCPAAVWTGTEMVMWGGIDGTNASTGDGAAFDLATGTWRVIAPAPIEARSHAAVAWTGSEMLVWGGLHRNGTVRGGSYNQTYVADGAAYNPTTDTWRRLPDAPLGAAIPTAVWTGEEFVILGASPLTDPDNTDDSITASAVAAYNPATDEWRSLADMPSGGRPRDAVWTGTTILATLAGPDPDMTDEPSNQLAHYDLSTDTWHIDAETGYAALIGVPDADGAARTVIAVPPETGAPVAVLDSEGNSIRSLPGAPVDRDQLSDRVGAHGLWVGGQALFEISGDWRLSPQGDPEVWSLHPASETWRRLPNGDAVFQTAGAKVAAGDVLLGTYHGDADATEPTDTSSGIIYRVPTNPTD
jgi:hypothetical protein